jgi:hypothetical protein
MNTQAHMTRHDLEAKIVQRSWEDEGFRNEFLADPSGSFSKYLQVPADSLPKIVVHEETSGSWHIVLPQRPLNAVELSEEDLEKAVGGSGPICGVTLLATLFASGMVVTGVTASVGASVAEGGW